MFKTATGVALAVSLIGVAAPSTAAAQTRNNRTVLTFSQPIEVPGRILPAGTYTFQRAVELAVAAKTVVPAVTVVNASLEELRTVPLVAITPERREAPIADLIQTTPVAEGQQARLLPRTASSVPLIALFGFLFVVAGLGLMAFRKPAVASIP